MMQKYAKMRGCLPLVRLRIMIIVKTRFLYNSYRNVSFNFL